VNALWANKLFTQPVNRSRSDGLDALRLILALWVFLAHSVGWSVYMGVLSEQGVLNYVGKTLIWLFQSNGETHPAVLAFIVLSGYCINRNGFRIGTQFSLVSYFIRRIFRILPVYLLAVILGVVLYLISADINKVLANTLLGTQEISLYCVLAKITGVSSFIPSLHTCSFQGNAPLTTAMVEIWLYVFYAVVVYCVLKGVFHRKILYLMIVVWLTSFGYVLLNPEYIGWWHNGSVVSFSLYWWIGAAISEYPPNNKGVTIFNYRIFVVAASVFVVVGSLSANLPFVELKKIGIAVFLAVVIRHVDNGWRSNLLARAGQAGYDIYAIHAPLVVLLLLNGVGFLFVILWILVISMVCHLAFERPLLEYGKRLAVRLST